MTTGALSTSPSHSSELTATVGNGLTELAARRAAHAEQDRRLHPEVVDAIIEAGFARHFVPESAGGQTGSFLDVTRATAALAGACSSAAWCASLTAHLGRMAAYLPEPGRAEVWSDGPDTVIVGALMPIGSAEPVPGGWRMNGRWPYVSMIESSRWVLACAMTTGEDRQARFFAIPRAHFSIERTWQSIGMRGTGSETLIVEDVFVPVERCFAREELLRGTPADTSAPQATPHRTPLRAVNGLCFGTPVHGAARGGLDAWIDSQRGRKTSDSSASVLARSSGELDAAWLLLERAASDADAGSVDIERATRDCALATELAVGAVERLYRAGGTSAAQDTAPLQRFWRDAHTGGSHIVLQFDIAARTFADHVLADH